MELLANDYVKICESPDPKRIYCYSPGLAALPNGNLIATMTYGGPGVKEHFRYADPLTGELSAYVGSIFLSRNGGETWEQTGYYPMMQARPFAAGNAVYILGHMGQLRIIRSDDCGETWSAPAALTNDGGWHQSACNVIYAKGNIYLTMEVGIGPGIQGWSVGRLAPVVMRAKVTDDLTRPESWTFADRKSFQMLIHQNDLNWFGVPFYETNDTEESWIAGRACAPMGWLETNVARITDPAHYWYDPGGNTVHIIGRLHSGGTGYGAFAKVVEHADGSMTTELERVPSGRYAAMLPLPGGQMRFHIEYDEVSGLWWLLSSQATDSMTRAELLPEGRFNLPNNERHRLQLSFSKNLVDWCFAGMVAIGENPKCSRHYASMAIDGDDLIIASRSADEQAVSAHDNNLITFHRVRAFRKLIY